MNMIINLRNIPNVVAKGTCLIEHCDEVDVPLVDLCEGMRAGWSSTGTEASSWCRIRVESVTVAEPITMDGT